jgi:thiol-disulfide isomerase/thioredoxin
MNEENIVIENSKENNPKNRRKQILEWLAIFAVGAVILFFSAPESWWQFGVSPAEKRKSSAGFSLPKLEGGANWNFTDWRGKVVVVNYWATWCPPCRVETPGLVKVASEYKSRGVEMVGVTMDENLETVPPFIEKYAIPYQILLPGSDPNLSADGTALPTTFLYDKNGKLAKKYTGIILESTLKSDIELLLNE